MGWYACLGHWYSGVYFKNGSEMVIFMRLSLRSLYSKKNDDERMLHALWLSFFGHGLFAAFHYFIAIAACVVCVCVCVREREE